MPRYLGSEGARILYLVVISAGLSLWPASRGEAMAGPVLVVRIPGTPFTLNDLRYDHGVLETARAVFEAGRLVSVHDLGTHETFEMLHPEPVRAAALAWASNAPNLMLRQTASSTTPEQEIALPQGLRRAQAAVFEQLGDRLVSRVEPECVIFRVVAAKDLAAATTLAARVRAVRPRTQIFAFGRIFEEHGILTRALKLFDAIALGDVFPACEILASPERKAWQRIQNLAYYDGARLTLTGTSKNNPVETACTPNSDKFLYISPAEYSKLHFFDVFAVGSIEVSAVVQHSGTYDDIPTSTVSTLRSITDQFGSRAFRFRGIEHSSEATLERRLLSSGMNLTFACTLDPALTAKTRMGLLAAAGCAAVDVDLSTGSQRLLDSYYRRDFTITDAERLMRASKFAGVFTAAHFTYPCVEDDYHTEDETLRLIRRANPSAVVITTETPKPGSGGLLAQEFGPFRRHMRQRALKQASQLKEKIRELNIPLDIDASTALLAGLAGYRAREGEFAELVGLQLLSGDTTGLAETIERINAAAARPARTGAFRPFTAEGNAVAN